MDMATVSPKYQIVIPRSIRERIHVRPGQELAVIAKGGIIHLVPIPTWEELRGIAKGANTEGIRDEEDRY
jgi:AbrB family looped-hinge helix DNA binding protein